MNISTGTAPIYVRITLHGKRAQLATSVWATAAEWDQKAGRMVGRSDHARRCQNRLTEMEGKVNDAYEDLRRLGPTTAEAVKAYVARGGRPAPVLEHTLLELSELFYRNEARPEQRKAVNTLRGYRTRNKQLAAYLQEGPAVPASAVTLPWLRAFERHCLDVWRYAPPTARKHVNHVQQIISFANHEGLLSTNEVRGYQSQVPMASKDPVYLSDADVQTLAAAQLQTKTLCESADAWLFCCYTGMSYVEYHRFEPRQHLHVDADGREWIRIERQKKRHYYTDKVSIPVFAEARELLDRYAGGVPKFSNQYLNRQLKTVGEALGLGLPLTLGLARHTASHRFRNLYRLSDESASAICGHSVKMMNRHYSRKREEGIARELEGLGVPVAGATPLERLRRWLESSGLSEEEKTRMLEAYQKAA